MSTMQRPPHPFVQASFISKLLFIWPYRLMNNRNRVQVAGDGGKRAAIEESDLPDVLEDDSSEKNLRRFHDMWEAEKRRASKVREHHLAHNTKQKPVPKAAFPSLHRAMAKDFLTTMWFIQPLLCAASAAKLVQALALGYLLQSFEAEADDTLRGNGYLWAGVLVLCGFVELMEHHHVFFYTWRKGMQYRISCVAAIYDKSLRLNSTSSTQQLHSSSKSQGSLTTSTAASSTGKIVNIATNDVERFLLSSLFVSYLFWAPVQSVAILCLGWFVVGWSFAVGFGILVFLFAPLQTWLSKKFGSMRSKVASLTDERVTMVSQAISGVRVMKMSGWEDNFEGRIASIRKKEVDAIERVNKYRALNEAMFYFCNVTISVIIFIIHVGSGGVLTPTNVFTTMVLMNVTQMEIMKHMSLGVMAVSECWVSINRIQRFLETPELEKGGDQLLLADDSDDAAVIASNVTCYWNGNGRSPSSSTLSASAILASECASMDSSGLVVALDEISVEFDMGSLTCVIGAVGSGKSALLQMLAGELPISVGTIRRRDCSLAYAPQDPWVMDGTVKENVLLGRDYHSDLYTNVMNACGLTVDLAQLCDGEDTIVGDRGVQLSGGQRARIALARAFYRDADIILLDDPLSAVDSRVGRLLFYSAIQELGVKRGKCVVLVTHQHQFIGNNKCVMMSGGRIACIGSYQNCVAASDGKLILATQNQSADDLTKLRAPHAKTGRGAKDRTQRGENVKKPEETETVGGANDHKEQSMVGVVKRETFLNYFGAMPGGITTGVLMVLLFAATQTSVLACIAVTGRWSEVTADEQMSLGIISVVAGLVVVVIFLSLFRAFMSFHLMIQTSKNLHDEMTRAVLRAKIEFFDTNPLGRILNRFSSDVGSNDDLLPSTLFDFSMCLFLVLGALVSAVVVLPVTLVFAPPLVWYFLRVRSVFLKTSRELKRLEGLARSPIFVMLSESLNGIATIRGNGALRHFQKKFCSIHDAHGRSFFAFTSCSRWLGFRMDSLMFVFLTVASFAAVVVHQHAWFNIEPSILGLALSMLTQLTGLFQWTIRQSAEVVNQFVAVERVNLFRILPSEAALTHDHDRKMTDWPVKGEIDVQDLSVRYRAGLPLSLHGLTFKIAGGSRVGIVGRTGGGKSTFVQCLLRLLEAEEGHIMIDGVDISKLGLHTLRTSISVIPQSPVLYGGCSLRENLDPFHHHTDAQISDALTDVHMLEAIRLLSAGLDTIVAEGGLNFSTGQRQLLCLARAILRRNKILVLDEPTANVDSHTDKLLQAAVAKSFHGATIVAVAHRLDTVIDYDRILVLGAGGVLEYGTPHDLIMSGGAFCSMIDDTGEEMADFLKGRAKKNAA